MSKFTCRYGRYNTTYMVSELYKCFVLYHIDGIDNNIKIISGEIVSAGF